MRNKRVFLVGLFGLFAYSMGLIDTLDKIITVPFTLVFIVIAIAIFIEGKNA